MKRFKISCMRCWYLDLYLSSQPLNHNQGFGRTLSKMKVIIDPYKCTEQIIFFSIKISFFVLYLTGTMIPGKILEKLHFTHFLINSYRIKNKFIKS